MNVSAAELMVKTSGPCRVDSPLAPLINSRHATYHYVEQADRVLFDDTLSGLQDRLKPPALETGNWTLDTGTLPCFEPAGPRGKIFFDPAKTRVGIVTCGGLCPGLNDVVRGLVIGLALRYGVKRIYGFTFGFQGFVAKYNRPVLDLTPEYVSDINEHGGTVLGSSRGRQDAGEIVDCLERMSINILYVIGGDGSLRGASAIVKEVEARGVKIAVVGVPKTIDNDILFIDQSFGFQTAFSEATKAIRAAHVEALGAPNGVGLVKLMGRHSGFIACYASLAMSDANFVLIPEVPFQLEGEDGFLSVLKRRLERRNHAVIVVAEGAGQDLLEKTAATDASGNAALQDVGTFLKERIQRYFKQVDREINLNTWTPVIPFEVCRQIRMMRPTV